MRAKEQCFPWAWGPTGGWLLATLLCWLWSPGFAAAATLQELAQATTPSVVHLDVLDTTGRSIGSGTGFLVSPQGRVVTNFHVIDEAGGMDAVLADGRRVEVVGVLAQDRVHDVAVLQLAPLVTAELPPDLAPAVREALRQLPAESYPALKLGSSKELKQGDEITVIGSPKGLAGSLSTGIVSALRGEGPGAAAARAAGNPESWTIQITAPISPGSSGSPVLATKDGTVIAVAVGKYSGESLNFAVPIEHARRLLERTGDDALPAPFARSGGGSQILLNLLISAAFFGAIALAFVVVPRLSQRRARA